MKIKRDPVKAAKVDIADILRNHEWLYHERHSPMFDCSINYELMADVVWDLIQGRTFGRGAIN
jgi:hypothetical protein